MKNDVAYYKEIKSKKRFIRNNNNGTPVNIYKSKRSLFLMVIS